MFQFPNLFCYSLNFPVIDHIFTISYITEYICIYYILDNKDYIGSPYLKNVEVKIQILENF